MDLYALTISVGSVILEDDMTTEDVLKAALKLIRM